MKMKIIDILRKSSVENVAQIIGAVVAMHADGMTEEEAMGIEYSETLKALQKEMEVDYKPTNADRIRSMNDEELAEFLCRVKADYQWMNPEYPSEAECGAWVEWLQREVEE